MKTKNFKKLQKHDILKKILNKFKFEIFKTSFLKSSLKFLKITIKNFQIFQIKRHKKFKNQHLEFSKAHYSKLDLKCCKTKNKKNSKNSSEYKKVKKWRNFNIRSFEIFAIQNYVLNKFSNTKTKNFEKLPQKTRIFREI